MRIIHVTLGISLRVVDAQGNGNPFIGAFGLGGNFETPSMYEVAQFSMSECYDDTTNCSAFYWAIIFRLQGMMGGNSPFGRSVELTHAMKGHVFQQTRDGPNNKLKSIESYL